LLNYSKVENTVKYDIAVCTTLKHMLLNKLLSYDNYNVYYNFTVVKFSIE